MTINRVLTVAAILGATTVFIYCSGSGRHLRQPRVYMAKIPNQPNAEAAQATRYLRAACPEVVLIADEPRADYKITALWSDAWLVIVNRKDLPRLLHREGSPDGLETFRQVCTAIRDDAKELADFDESTQSMPVGRYLLHSTNPDRLFLLDTKTGAVWQLEQIGDTQQFDRVKVEGLYYKTMVGSRQ